MQNIFGFINPKNNFKMFYRRRQDKFINRDGYYMGMPGLLKKATRSRKCYKMFSGLFPPIVEQPSDDYDFSSVISVVVCQH